MAEDVTNDLVGVVCQPSQMASGHISSFIRRQRTDFCVPLCGKLIKKRGAAATTFL
jgi:hypothetical protein